MPIDVVVPTLGESVTEAIIAEWKFADGDAVKQDDILVELETDKVSVEVAAPQDGVMRIMAQNGATVAVGDALGRIEEGSGGNQPASPPTPPAPAPQVTQQPAPPPPAPPAPAPQVAQPAPPPPAPMQNVKAGPAVRQAMRQQGIEAQGIKGSGAHGNIVKSDLANVARPTMHAPANPFVTAESLAERQLDPRGEERVKLSKLRQTIAIRLKEAQNNAAMLTTFNEVDMTALIELRRQYKDAFEKKYNIRLGFMSFFAKAAVAALHEIPSVNAEIYGDEIIYKNYYDIGIAVGSKQGLVVPVVRDIDKINFANIENKIHDFGVRAQSGKITIDEMRGGTFTITNGGVFGSLLSTPILNPPQSAILGMHQIQKRPIVKNDEIVIADMMYLALSYDHRIIDGREAVTFLVRIKQLIEAPSRLLLDV
ncbi:MAG: 2-oxoglutarate dehydrogenase complex dihydrolipoyllysine-residue succinyltransferase [Alphaproteobacteria bacterium]|nr:2-oxoglutarate dehydrogenase complex dihydrolipoyllysine-residue succinyltransferase [Alphaproteobacteria bacterium]